MKSKLMIVLIVIITVLTIGYLYFTNFKGGKSIIDVIKETTSNSETVNGMVKEIEDDTIVLVLMDNNMMNNRPNMNEFGDRPQKERPSDEELENMPRPEDGEFPSFDGNDSSRSRMMFGEEKTYKINKDTTFKDESGNLVTLSDIKVGSILNVTIVSGKIKEITIMQMDRTFNESDTNNNNNNNNSSDEL